MGTVLIRGGSKTICDEARRCLHDAICVVRNMVKNSSVVGGGGATELCCSIEVTEGNDFLGVDAMHKGTTNMHQQGIFESMMSKKSQLELATQVVKMILKIDDVIAP